MHVASACICSVCADRHTPEKNTASGVLTKIKDLAEVEAQFKSAGIARHELVPSGGIDLGTHLLHSDLSAVDLYLPTEILEFDETRLQVHKKAKAELILGSIDFCLLHS